MQRARVHGAVCMQVGQQCNVCAWMHAGERATQCLRMDAVDDQCRVRVRMSADEQCRRDVSTTSTNEALVGDYDGINLGAVTDPAHDVVSDGPGRCVNADDAVERGVVDGRGERY